MRSAIKCVIGFLLAPACAFGAAAAGPPAPKGQVIDLQTEVEQAVRYSAFEGFAGTVEFVKGTAEQHWTIMIDSLGRVRAQIDLPQSDLRYPLFVGQTPDLLWLVEEETLSVWHRDALTQALAEANGPIVEDNGPILATSLVNQSFAELEWLGMGPAKATSEVVVRTIDRDSEPVRATVDIDGKRHEMAFDRFRGRLLPVYDQRGGFPENYDDSTYAWTFHNIHEVENRWVPGGATLVRSFAEDKQAVYEYRAIIVKPEPAISSLRSVFEPPHWGQHGYAHVEVHKLFTKQNGLIMTTESGLIDQE